MILFVDLDGPILDVSERYFAVHQQVLEGLGGRSQASKMDYWRLKREAVSLEVLLRRTGNDDVPIEKYRERWLRSIESEQVLSLDKVIDGSKDQLSLWRPSDVVLVTLRQRQDLLQRQLSRLGLRPFFGTVLCGDPRVAQGWETKSQLVQSTGLGCAMGVIVGDTEVDIRCGKQCGFLTIGVLSGIRNEERLKLEEPDYIIAGIRDLRQTLKLADSQFDPLF